MNILLKDFMLLCLMNPEIPLSWGISNIVNSEMRINFKVFGSRKETAVELSISGNQLIVQIERQIEIFTDAKEAFFWIDRYIE